MDCHEHLPDFKYREVSHCHHSAQKPVTSKERTLQFSMNRTPNNDDLDDDVLSLPQYPKNRGQPSQSPSLASRFDTTSKMWNDALDLDDQPTAKPVLDYAGERCCHNVP